MKTKNINLKKILKNILVAGIFIIVALVIIFFLYVSIYYKADSYSKSIVLENKHEYFYDKNIIVFEPEEKGDVGLIFYPGAKVEAIAYAPLLNKLSSYGITTIIVEMPFNLAVFGINRADHIYDKFPHINRWYIGGHSLGGAMASIHAYNNMEKLEGLILLGAYPVEGVDINMVAIYGSNDNIINRERLQAVENRITIQGGNHAYFGNYGEQSGDGVATITREQQQEKTIEIILEFIKNVL